MNLTQIIILGVLGVSSFLFLCYAILIFVKEPYEFVRLNNPQCKSNIFYKWLMLLAPVVAIIFGNYHIVYFLLGWMPENWGNVGEDGFETTRSALSTTLGIMSGSFFAYGISRGVDARVELSTIKVEDYLSARIESARENGKLDDFKKTLEKFLAGELLFSVDENLDDVINKSGLPFDYLKELFRDAMRKSK